MWYLASSSLKYSGVSKWFAFVAMMCCLITDQSPCRAEHAKSQLSFWEKTAVIKKTASPLGKRKKRPGEEPTTTHRLQPRVLRRWLGARLVCYPEGQAPGKEDAQLVCLRIPGAWRAGTKTEDWAYQHLGWLSEASFPGRGRQITIWAKNVTANRKEWAPSSAQRRAPQGVDRNVCWP